VKPRIFLIGFNKCGTTSFHSFFQANNISSVHWRGNTLATQIYDNLRVNKEHLLGDLDKWQAYTDMICIPGAPWDSPNSESYPVIEACSYFRELDQCYPGSLFILNTRSPDSWLVSRLKHDNGRFADAYTNSLRKQGLLGDEEISSYWLRQWHDHHHAVQEYFSRNRTSQFLYFDIERNTSQDLVEFIGQYYLLQDKHFPHTHKSS